MVFPFFTLGQRGIRNYIHINILQRNRTYILNFLRLEQSKVVGIDSVLVEIFSEAVLVVDFLITHKEFCRLLATSNPYVCINTWQSLLLKDYIHNAESVDVLMSEASSRSCLVDIEMEEERLVAHE